jgi:hypothetical protein
MWFTALAVGLLIVAGIVSLVILAVLAEGFSH